MLKRAGRFGQLSHYTRLNMYFFLTCTFLYCVIFQYKVKKYVVYQMVNNYGEKSKARKVTKVMEVCNFK